MPFSSLMNVRIYSLLAFLATEFFSLWAGDTSYSVCFGSVTIIFFGQSIFFYIKNSRSPANLNKPRPIIKFFWILSKFRIQDVISAMRRPKKDDKTKYQFKTWTQALQPMSIKATQLQPIRTAGQITAHIKIRPTRQPIYIKNYAKKQSNCVCWE